MPVGRIGLDRPIPNCINILLLGNERTANALHEICAYRCCCNVGLV